MLQLRYELPMMRFRQLGIWEISPRVTDIYCRDGRDVHANRAETSLLMHAAPHMVRPELAFDVPDVTVGHFWSYDMPRTTRTGVVGRPSESTREDGEAMASIMVEDFEGLGGKARRGLARGPGGSPQQDPEERVAPVRRVPSCLSSSQSNSKFSFGVRTMNFGGSGGESHALQLGFLIGTCGLLSVASAGTRMGRAAAQRQPIRESVQGALLSSADHDSSGLLTGRGVGTAATAGQLQEVVVSAQRRNDSRMSR